MKIKKRKFGLKQFVDIASIVKSKIFDSIPFISIIPIFIYKTNKKEKFTIKII